MNNNNDQITCDKMGFKCNMQPNITEETVPIFAHRRLQSNDIGDDFRFSELIPYGNPIGYEKKYTAYYKCIYCGKIEPVGSIQVPLTETLTFDDFILEKEMHNELNNALLEFDNKQLQERIDFIRQFRKDYKKRVRK